MKIKGILLVASMLILISTTELPATEPAPNPKTLETALQFLKSDNPRLVSKGIDLLQNYKTLPDHIVVRLIQIRFTKLGNDKSLPGLVFTLDIDQEIKKGRPEIVGQELKPYVADPKTRWDAVGITKELGPNAAMLVPELTAALEDKNENVRSLAARSLGNIGPKAKDAAPLLGKLLASDANENACDSAAEAIGQIGVVTPEIIKALLKACADPEHTNYYAEASLKSLRFDPAPFLPDLLPLLSQFNTQDLAGKLIAQIGIKAAPAVIDYALKKKASDDDGTFGLMGATSALVAIGKGVEPLLEPDLKSPDPKRRLLAVATISKLRENTQTDTQWLKPFLADESSNVRCRALAAYITGEKNISKKIAIIRQYLAGNDPEMRSLAIRQAGSLGAKVKSLLSELKQLLRSSTNLEDQAELTENILCINLTDKDGLESLFKLLGSKNEDVVKGLISTCTYRQEIGQRALAQLRKIETDAARPEETRLAAKYAVETLTKKSE